MPKKILIVDDEKLARQRLIRFIKSKDQEFILEEAANGIEAIQKIPNFKPDIVFLDIAMPGLNGFEVLAQLENRNFVLVFQTAFDNFAIKAFEENACDYLLKPFTSKRFEKALDRALSLSPNNNSLENLENNLQKEKGYLSKIIVKHRSELKIIPIEEVHAFVSRDHYTFVCTEKSEFICGLSLTHLEKRLSPQEFKRLHRDNIVRLKAIDSLVLGENMSAKLKMGLVISVSRNNRKIAEEFKKYL